MTDKELRRLSRRELLEMLVTATEENERLRGELAQARAELESRRILLDKSGSMAEAALRLNGVFEAADRAAQQYLENIRRMAEESREIHEITEAWRGDPYAADLCGHCPWPDPPKEGSE